MYRRENSMEGRGGEGPRTSSAKRSPQYPGAPMLVHTSSRSHPGAFSFLLHLALHLCCYLHTQLTLRCTTTHTLPTKYAAYQSSESSRYRVLSIWQFYLPSASFRPQRSRKNLLHECRSCGRSTQYPPVQKYSAIFGLESRPAAEPLTDLDGRATVRRSQGQPTALTFPVRQSACAAALRLRPPAVCTLHRPFRASVNGAALHIALPFTGTNCEGSDAPRSYVRTHA